MDSGTTESGDGLSGRLERLVSLAGSQARAAAAAGVSLSQFKRYLGGESQPGFRAMVRLAHATGVRLDWLAMGQGAIMAEAPTDPPLDQGLMEIVIVECERFLQARGLGLEPSAKGILMLAVYRMALRAREGGADPASVLDADTLNDLVRLSA
ncbi:helix-turn-helix domain-containing protein [Magnetospira sp. QH-2]|uniref:helix-turn-helix domain-containing protein n=1 Tax=Magnetospira sp. (strain QH-2) TaxID=1288970 RepID=UPI0003E812DF|nr:helix-turn-helix domain-containing protein [Magnetospira sp. QH-2]CCQ74632.1 putative Transcriptional regulator [Magnetospira sp. QH-2]